MYGSIARYRPRPECAAALEGLARRWLWERAPVVDGYIGTYLLKPGTSHDEWFSLALFDSEQSYRKHAADPEQDRWRRQVRALLAAEPLRHEGEVIELVPEIVAL